MSDSTGDLRFQHICYLAVAESNKNSNFSSTNIQDWFTKMLMTVDLYGIQSLAIPMHMDHSLKESTVKNGLCTSISAILRGGTKNICEIYLCDRDVHEAHTTVNILQQAIKSSSLFKFDFTAMLASEEKGNFTKSSIVVF